MSDGNNSVHLNQEYTPEVRIRDLVFHLLYRWRSILLAALVCGIVFGTWQYFSVDAAHKAGNKTRDEQRYEQNLVDYQRNLTEAQEKLQSWQDRLDERTAYLNNSLLMQLDPANVWIAEKKYLITGIGRSAADLLAVYTGALAAEHDGAALQEAFGTDNAGYVSEVVSFTADTVENSFRVAVYAQTREAAEKGLAYVAGKIEEAGAKAQEIAPHTLQTVSEGASLQILDDLTAKKSAVLDEIFKYQDKIKTSQRSVNGAAENEPLAPGDPVKSWAVTGAGLGLLAMIGIYMVSFLTHGKLHRAEEISEQYSVPVFGEMNRSGARRSGKGIDGWLEKLQFRKEKKSDGQVYDNAAAMVKEKRVDGTLVLAGTVGGDMLESVKKELEKRLGEEVDISVCAGFPEESGSVESVNGAGSVVWVEEKHVSRNEGIKRAAEVFEAVGAKVIGVLVV